MSQPIDHLARRLKRGGLVPYLTAGDGGLERTEALLDACDAAGVALVELGVPFSDPVADGPVLQAAVTRALENGTTLEGVVELVRRFRAKSRLPVAIFSYANPIWRMGLERAASTFADAGVDAVLVPDVPWEESAPLRAAMSDHGISVVLFCAPTTTGSRLERICADTRGFLYAIGRFGVTGGETRLDGAADAFVSRVRQQANTPVGLGFGLRTAAQVAHVLARTELAIVGSALVDRIHRAADPVQECHDYLAELMSEASQ